MRGVACHGETRLEQRALIRLVLLGNASRDRLQALEPRGRFEVRALLAAMQGSTALRAGTLKIDVRKKGGGAVEAAGCRYRLHQPRQTRPCDIDRWPRTLRLGALIALGAGMRESLDLRE